MMPDAGSVDKPQLEATALGATADFIKVSVSLSVGAFVFGIGLFTNTGSLVLWERVLIVAAEVLLLLSIVSGYAASSRIPIMIVDGTSDINDRRLSCAGRGHQLAFFAGILALAIVLGRNLFSDPAVDDMKAGTAVQAFDAALRRVDPAWRVQSIESVEFVRGVDTARPILGLWHLRFKVTRKSDKLLKQPRSIDYLVESETGKVSHVP